MQNFLRALCLTMLLSVFSCSDGVLDTSSNLPIIEKEYSSSYSIYSYNPEFIQVDQDSLVEISFKRDSIAKRNVPTSIFTRILSQLNLDSTQRSQTALFLAKHHECIKECSAEIKQQERRIIDSAKVIRISILEDVKAGVITKLEGREKMRVLNERVKSAIKSLSEKYKVKDCIENCDREFIISLSSILNPEQLQKFNSWVHFNGVLKEKKEKRDSIGIGKKRDTIRIKG